MLLLRHLLDLFFHHGCIGHALRCRHCILVLGPLLNLVICAFHELISQVQEDGLGALFNDLPSDALQRITIDIDRLDRLMETEPVRQIETIVVDHGKGGHLG